MKSGRGKLTEDHLTGVVDSFVLSLKELFNSLEKEKGELVSQLDAMIDRIFPTVSTFVQLLEGRDSFTYDHSRRIARYCVHFAGFLNWSLSDIQRLNTAALLHDIGKIIIPDSILQKEGKFEPLEYETMKLHSSTGSRIINNLGFLGTDIESWILHHHERFDGTGYPDGISSDEIPAQAMIIALSDAFDAMTSPRRYKQRVEPWVALDEITRCAGRQFEPDLALKLQEAIINLEL